MAIAEEASDPLSAKEVLENALMLMTQNKVAYVWSNGPTNYGGQAAYLTWAKAVENDNYFAGGTDNMSCQIDAETMVGEGRLHAAIYIESLLDEIPGQAQLLQKCAGLLKAAAACAQEIATLHSQFSTKENRIKIAALIRKAADYEKQACLVLAKILDKTPSQINEIEQQLNEAAAIVAN
ncbi:MAG: hypothetical protein FWC32_10065 [Firmicutes bacterium]|nr:hypothetical protein [Bacillota bacterium]